MDPDMALLQSVMNRVSVPPPEKVPYYATPKIMVHKPSESSYSDRSGPRTIDEVLARSGTKRRVSFSGGEEPQPDRTRTAPPTVAEGDEASAMATGTTIHKKARVKKRSLYLRKARNLAARKTILRLTLGRQLAVPTKEALRHLAKGESVIVIEPQSGEALPRVQEDQLG